MSGAPATAPSPSAPAPGDDPGASALRERLRAADRLARVGRADEAGAAFEQILRERPDSAEAAIALARLAQARGDVSRAERTLQAACAANPAHELLAVELAVVRAGAGDLAAAIEGLRRHLEDTPAAPLAWLLLGQMLDDTGRGTEALLARLEALAQAHALGLWLEQQTIAPHLQDAVAAASASLRAHRSEVFRAVVEPLRRQHGEAALARVERAIAGYLGEIDTTPADPMQRPRFLHFPDLPVQPYMDPALQPWAARLQAAFADIRAEALAVLLDRDAGDPLLEDFIRPRAGDRIENYLGGRQPSWEAFFFWRHGRRYDEHHARCPRTSAVLESLDLVRIPGQTPEICFSVLAPGTHILPHHGVTNTRAVMHLPLVVPPDCALNLVGRGAHAWREGELVLFDDTFLHEAWNRSGTPRVILLMDCWNPHLTAVERDAVVRLARAIGVVDVALKA